MSDMDYLFVMEDTEIYSKGGTGAATMLLYEVVKLMEKPYKSY